MIQDIDCVYTNCSQETSIKTKYNRYYKYNTNWYIRQW